jgi:starch synthase
VILHAHPMGNTFVRELAIGLVESELLTEHWTALDYPERETWLKWLPTAARRQMQRRRLPAVVKPFARLRPWPELGRLFGPSIGLGGLAAHEHGRCSVDRVFRDLDLRVARRLRERPEVRGVYLYEDGAADSFTAARGLGVRTFYDLPIGYWRVARQLLREEAELSPEWAGTLRGNADSDAKLERKDQELALSDTVFVASSFTRQTLMEYPGKALDVVVVPYGAPLPEAGIRPSIRRSDEPLKVLFVGSLGQRKGLRYLLEAMDRLGGAAGFTLSLIGTLPGLGCRPLVEAVREHRHISSLPHREILAEMRRHHVLVLPSLFEGFGLVLTEAMANGLPIIATSHTAAPDLIQDGVEGCLVPIRSAEQIAAKLVDLRDNEERRQAMGAAAIRRSQEMAWVRYQQVICQTIRDRLSDQT